MNETFEGTESEFEATDVAQSAADCGCEVLSKGKTFIRSNPVPTVLGALALGVAIGLCIPRCCEEEEPVGRLTGKLDELKDLLSSLGGKVSASAEDQYDGLSSAIGSTIKKAKKRFNIS